MFEALKKLIGYYTKEEMKEKLDVFLAKGRITQEEYNEIIGAYDEQGNIGK